MSPTWRCLCALHTTLWSSPPTYQLSFDTASKPEKRIRNHIWKHRANTHIHTSEKHLTHSTQPVIMCFLGHAELALRSDCLLFLAKVHLVPGSPACENLDRSHHTVEKDRERKYKEKQVRKPWMKQIQNYFLGLCYFDTKDSGWFSKTLYQTVIRRGVGNIFFFTLAWTAYDANRTEASGEQNISSSKICFFTYKSRIKIREHAPIFILIKVPQNLHFSPKCV